MTACTLDSSVPDWVIEHPETFTVFQTLGIDSSCGGKSLEFACQEQGLKPQDVLALLLRSLGASPDQQPPDGKIELGK